MSIGIILPVRNGAVLLDRLAGNLRREAQANGASVTIVDDASTDGTHDRARAAGFDVIRLSDPGGPYKARNIGWRASAADQIVFTDARCRPRPGWLASLVNALDQPGVAIAGGDVIAERGTNLAAAYVYRHQPLIAERGLRHEFLPFLPTANLATTRRVLNSVEGFREIRSGGDLDFCWRVQLAGLGQVVFAPGAAVDWLPRATLRAVIRQWHRYGLARACIEKEYANHGWHAQAQPGIARFAARELKLLATDMRKRPISEWRLNLLDRACYEAWWAGYRRASGAGSRW